MRGRDNFAGATEFDDLREARSQYYGLMTEVDDNLGRLFQHLKDIGAWQDTLIVFTSDHGEQMGDHWLWSKLGFYDSSYHIPLIIRDPKQSANLTRGSQIHSLSENIDIMPTLLDWLGADTPSQCDGRSLLPILHSGVTPSNWRQEVYWEYDFRDVVGQRPESAFNITSHQCNLSVVRSKAL